MPTSLESSRPIMAPSVTSSNRASVRFSTYSMAPSVTPTVRTTDSATAEIRDIETGLARMENKALSEQRVVLTEEKTDKFGKLALGAKLDRALDRRMSGQDAVMKPRLRKRSEKPSSNGSSNNYSDSEKENEKRAAARG